MINKYAVYLFAPGAVDADPTKPQPNSVKYGIYDASSAEEAVAKCFVGQTVPHRAIVYERTKVIDVSPPPPAMQPVLVPAK